MPESKSLDDVAILLLAEKISKEVKGADAAARWSAPVARAILELVASQKGRTEDADVCLLREVKTKFKAHGVSNIGAREKAIAIMQDFLTPKAKPKSEDRTFLTKEFLKAAQAGALVEMRQMLAAHPSILSGRSSSKGYTAAHYAAMAGALPVLDWLTSQGLNPDGASTPSDGSPPCTPAQVAEEYKRDLAASRCRSLAQGFRFLQSIPNAQDDDSRLRAACRAGNAEATAMLLRKDPSLARRPAALAPTGALFAAASGGHVSCLRELIRCGGVEMVSGSGPSALQAAVASQQAETANVLHLHERATHPLQVGHWNTLPSSLVTPNPTLPLLSGLVVDAKISRARSVLVEAYDMQLASAVGAPGMERCLVRWVESHLGMPLWVPVDMELYVQLDEAVKVALDALHSAQQREALMHLSTSRADALHRLNSLLAYVPFPGDVTRVCRRGMATVMGEELAESTWNRLTPEMQRWCARVIFLLPCTPWGHKGAGMAALSRQVAEEAAARKAKKDEPRSSGWVDDEDEDGGTAAAAAGGGADPEADRTLQLLCLMELLGKARILYHLFDDDHSAASRRLHCVLPIQPQDTSLCPFAVRPGFDRTDPTSYSAVLLLLAPLMPDYLRTLYPHILLLNDGGIGGEMREKLGHRIALRMLLSGAGAHASVAPWVALPAVYSEHLALACLSRLGGPNLLMLRHPHAVKFTAEGGGEISCDADDLDAVLLVLLEPERAFGSRAEATHVPPKKLARVRQLVDRARFWPPGEGPQGAGSCVLLLEELSESQPLPQDGRKGWFDPTHRAYCVQATTEWVGGRPPPPPPETPRRTPAVSAASRRAGSNSDDSDDTEEAPVTDVTDRPTEEAAAAKATANEGSEPQTCAGSIHVLSGCSRFPHQNLACGATNVGGVHSQHAPLMPHTAVPLGPEMARGAFSLGGGLPIGPLLDALHACSLCDLVTHCLSSPQHPLLHLVGLSVLGGASAGAHKLIEDPLALHFHHFEYFGRPFAVAVELHAEHKELLDELLEPTYAQRYGKELARLVQKSFLRDVVSPDLACVACNALRPPSTWVTHRLKRMLHYSQFEDVKDMARAIHQHYYSVAKTRKLNEHGEEAANEKHMQMLLDDLEVGLG